MADVRATVASQAAAAEGETLVRASLASQAAAAEGEALVREHLDYFLQRNGPDASFESWIAQLHPENVTLDHRLRLPSSRHAALWEQSVRSLAAAAASDAEEDEQVYVTPLAASADALWPSGPRPLGRSDIHSSAAATSAKRVGAREPVAPDRVVRVRIDPRSPRQRMLGWGGAMTESSAALIMASPNRDAILDDLFLPPSAGGAGVRVVRVPLGSSDFALDPPGAATYRDSEALPFDGTRDAAVLVPCLQAAARRTRRLVLIGSPWSAPAWMKTSGALVGGSLKKEMVPAYCRYLMQAILFWRSHNLPLYAITLQNEPYHGKAAYPCMAMTEDMQSLLAADLCRLLRSNGLPTRILAHDHNYAHAPAAALTLRLARERLGGCVDGSAWHAYEGTPDELEHDEIMRLPIYITEQTAHSSRPRHACSSAPSAAAWSVANVTLGPVLRGAVCGLQWNLALDDKGGPVLRGGPVNCRGVVEIPRGGGHHDRSPEWYVLAHAAAAGNGGWCVSAGRGVEGREGAVQCEGGAVQGKGVALNREEDVRVAIFGVGGGDGLKSGGGGSAPDGTFRYGVFAHNASGMPAVLELSFEGADGARSLLLPPHSLLSASRLVPPQGISFLPPPPDAPLRPPRECRLPPAVLLRSRAHGTFLAAHGQDASLVYQSEIPEGGQPGTWEVWRPVETSPRAWRLLSVHGTLLGVNADRQLVQLDGSNALAALELTIFFFDDGSVGLCGDLGNVHMPARKRLGAGWGLPRLRQCAFGAWEALEAIPAHI